MNLKRLTAALVLSLLTLQGCSTSPLGRSQLLMQNEASLAASAEQEYLKMKKEVVEQRRAAMQLDDDVWHEIGSMVSHQLEEEGWLELANGI